MEQDTERERERCWALKNLPNQQPSPRQPCNASFYANGKPNTISLPSSKTPSLLPESHHTPHPSLPLSSPPWPTQQLTSPPSLLSPFKQRLIIPSTTEMEITIK